MTTTNQRWEDQFRAVYDRAVAAYGKGAWEVQRCIAASDLPFLASIGCSAQVLFDFVEDWCGSRDPSFEEVLAVISIRREYFLEVQKGQPSGRVMSVSEFPAKTAAVDGIAWLPRLLVKAEAKLRGELPAELMYGCGGDRPFLRGVRVGLAEFLAAVRDAKGNHQAVIDLVKTRSGSKR
jgi:hypothetical protein